MTNVGLPELMARDAGEYVRIAAGLAANTARLDAMRSGLRSRMRASPPCDARRFVAELERFYRGAWAEWCAGRRAVMARAANAPGA
ncbi:MAG: hypothetical protein OEP48_10605 [Betaproteobacteria bacterium]|nr:hypothetical protein [Betaproteobacteria bacterium]MDH3439064.1 hypothetical protein [Betaproteobacteria bacterium]